MSHPSPETDLLSLTRRLLAAIDDQDWSAYCELCDPSLTAYEPEAVGQLVEGMDFHRFYFEMKSSGRAKQSTITSPRVRLLGEDVAVVTYVRLLQRTTDDGSTTTACEETRIWQRQEGTWKNVHFHRSKCGEVQL